MKLPTFFIFFFVLVLALTTYCSVRGFQIIRPLPLAYAYLSVFILMFASLFVGMIWGAYFPPFLGKAITLFGYTFIIVFVYLLASFILTDIFRLLNLGFHFVSPETMLSIRQWIFASVLILTTVSLVIGNYKFNHPKVVDLEVNAENPRQGKKLKLVMASDLHLSVVIDKKQLAKYVDMINAQQPDMVVFAGDVVDRDLKPLFDQKMYEEFKQIKAPLGIYAVNGNHEYISGDISSAQRFYEEAGITLLQDSACLVDGSFYIIGRDDYSNRQRKRLSEITAGLDSEKFRILLDHQPNNLSEARNNNINLQLSGHTHNGQFFPINLFVKRIFEVGYGYKKIADTHFYVSSGLGIWGPQYRIGTQSELVAITVNL